MKICPTCRQTYNDDSLNFCLNDGAVLTHTNEAGNNQQTVFMGQPKPTNQAVNNQFSPQQNNFRINQQTIPKPRKSRAWMWVIGVVGGVILLMVIGFAGLVGIGLMLTDTNTNTNSNTSVSNTIKDKSNSSTSQNDNLPQTDDFSSWRRETNSIGTTGFINNEYIAASKQENYYYVITSGNDNFITSNATTKVLVRNLANKPTKFGFGLVVKSNPSASSRYAFLIETVKQTYRIVLHMNNKESVIVNWTKSSAILPGSQLNELKVKDENGKMTFYINGQFITSVTDSTGLKSGIAGIYTSGAVPIAFFDLEISK